MVRRVAIALGISLFFGTLLAFEWSSGPASILVRAAALGLIAALVFTVFERWPRRLPRWIARWVLQVVSVGVAMPIATITMWMLSTANDAPPFWTNADRMEGFLTLTILALLVAPWTALAALVRQREALARHQALAFELERSESRLRLLQAQVAPHFLFNTLANVQELVDAGSPHASAVLRSLISYLRAAVPLLEEPAATLGRELQLVRAYLELMHLRMPDRLQYALHVDESALALRCAPTTLLTLVENAVRHGIDPSEEGGTIEIDVQRRDGRCLIRVNDTGVGLRASDNGLGTGLSTLRERLQMMFGDDAQLRVTEQQPHGVCAELDLPAQTETP